MFARAFGSRTLLIVPADEKVRPGMYEMVLVNFLGPRSMVVVLPNATAFAQMVKAGEMRGVVERDSSNNLKDVILEDLSGKECSKLFDKPNQDAFYWENPGVLIRTGPR